MYVGKVENLQDQRSVVHAWNLYDSLIPCVRQFQVPGSADSVEEKNTRFYQICLELRMTTHQEGRDLMIMIISEKDSSLTLS